MEGLENVYDVELVRICQTEVQVWIGHGLWETRLDKESGVQSRRTLFRARDLHTSPSFPLLCRRAALPPDTPSIAAQDRGPLFPAQGGTSRAPLHF